MFAPQGAEACVTSCSNWLVTGRPQPLKWPRLAPLPGSAYYQWSE